MTDKGFGFVRDGETREEYFLHRSACEPQALFDQLLALTGEEQPWLSYRLGSSPKGPRAFEARMATEKEIADGELSTNDAAEDNFGNR